MLMPTALKVPQFSFIDVEDLDARSFSTKAKAPLTGAQQERLEREIRLQEIQKDDEFEKEMKKI